MIELIEILKIVVSAWMCYVALMLLIVCYCLHKIFKTLNW